MDIINVLAKGSIAKFAGGLAKAGKIETQSGDAELCELFRGAGGAGSVAGAGEAMGKNGIGDRGRIREVDGSGHLSTPARRQLNVDGLHENYNNGPLTRKPYQVDYSR